ncbi:PQQ-binding-like beta-propeller repeat protein [Actinomycetes bacterium KLBMP 9797]
MTSPVVVIELGEIRREPPEPTPEPSWSPAQRRRVAGLVAAVALVTSLAAATPLPRPLAETSIPAEPGDSVFGEGDRYYVIEGSHGRPPGTRTVAAYALPDARALWRVPLMVDGAVRRVAAIRDGLLVSLHHDGQVIDAVETVAIAADDGEPRWRRRARVEGVTPVRGNVVLWNAADGVPAAATGRETVAGVDPITAEVRWSYRVPMGGWLSYREVDGRPTHVVTLLPSGRVEVRDLEDGRLLAAADGLLPSREPATPTRYAQVAGDLLVVRADRRTVIAYGLARLDRRWEAPVDSAIEDVSADCAPVLCVVSRSRGMRVLDPDTGGTRWTSGWWTDPRRAGAHLVVNQAGRRAGVDRLVVIDPDTGRPVGELGDWTTLGAGDGRGQLLGVRVDHRTLRAWFAWLDPEHLSVRVVHVAAGVTGRCDAHAGAIICRRLDSSLGVWHL